MQFTAVYRYATIAPGKVRGVADLIRGKHVNDALQILRAANKRGASMVDKVLRSAIANADQSLEADMESLHVSQVWVDEGPMRRKWWPRARGRAVLIRKRSSHINVVLDDQA
jgi:large subunit ribosomal protein L22